MVTTQQLTAAEQAIIDAKIIRSNSVNLWLEKLKATDAARFESVRQKKFEEIAILAGV